MFVKGIRKAIGKGLGPPGCNPLDCSDRMPVLKVVSGDTWTIDANLSAADGSPASPGNSHVEFVLSENQFSPPLWTGVWVNGVLPDGNKPGLVHVNIPREITKALRRGSYMFSIRVSDMMRHSFGTQLCGNFLVEYMPTSDQRSIPYRDGTSEIFGPSGSGSGQSAHGGSVQNASNRIFIPDPDTGLEYELTATRVDGKIYIQVNQSGRIKRNGE